MPNTLSLPNFVTAAGGTVIDVIDMHTAGEPVRIVARGYPELEGETLLQRRRDAQVSHDRYRRQMMLEPRGHGGMYGVIPLPPTRAGIDLSVLFTHAGGYSTMCGHATIAIARWAIESGRVAAVEPVTNFTLECPCGPVSVMARVEQGQVVSASFDSVPAFIDALNVAVSVGAREAVTVDIVYGGAYYALLPASRLGLDFDRDHLATLTEAAAKLFIAARDTVSISRPDAPDLAFLYGVILIDDAAWPEPTRNLCVFGDGQVDRSPTGSGVTARLAYDVLKGDGAMDIERLFFGPTGQSFRGSAIATQEFEGRPAIIARISGESYYAAQSTLLIERGDPLGDGFLLTNEAV